MSALVNLGPIPADFQVQHLDPDLNQAAEHILALTGYGNSKVTFQTFDDNPRRREESKKKNGKDPFARILHGTLIQVAERLRDLNKKAAGIYVTINETDGKGRTAGNIVRVRALAVDDDGTMTRPYALRPSYEVISSAGRKWAVWTIKGAITRDDFTPAQKLLAAYYSTDEIHDLPRVMRLAGFYNCKSPVRPFRAQFVPGSGTAYTLTEVIAAHTEAPAKGEKKPPASVKPATVKAQVPKDRTEKLIKVVRDSAAALNWTKNHRHASAKTTAAHARKLGLPEDAIRAVTMDYLTAAGKTAEEAEDIVKWTVANVSVDPDEIDPPGGKPVSAIPTQSEPWLDPVDFTAPVDLPAFPVEALPKELGAFASELAASVQVPVDLAATLILAVTAAASGNKFRVQVGDTHEEPVCVYTCAVADPGTRKTEIFKHTTRPMDEIEEEEIKSASPIVARATERRKVAEERLVKLRRAAASASDEKEAARIGKQAEDLFASLPDVPALPSFIVSDVTPEHLGQKLHEQGGKIALFDADAALFDILAGRYSEKPNLEIFLKAHAGDPIRVGRAGRQVMVMNPFLTIGVCVQPSVIMDMATSPTFRGRGLVGRILFSVPPSMVGTRVYQNRPIDRVTANTYRHVIRDVFSFPSAGTGHDVAHRLKIEGAALAEWTLYADRVERDQVEGGHLFTVRDFASKAAGAAARIAGLFHLVRYRSGSPSPWCIEIGAEDVAAACSCMEYFEEHFLAASALMSGSPEVATAKRILRWIRRRALPEAPFSLRDVYRDLNELDVEDDIEPALDVLEARGFIRPEAQVQRSGPGRKPSPRYEVNPRLTSPGTTDEIDRKEAIG